MMDAATESGTASTATERGNSIVPEGHTRISYEVWSKVNALRQAGSKVVLDGYALGLSSVVAIALHNTPVSVTESPITRHAVDQSIAALEQRLREGCVIYGVNTGFGGSADTRTQNYKALQLALLQHTQSAIIPSSEMDGNARLSPGFSSHTLPVTWVKATLVVRANQSLRGHGGARLEVIKALVDLVSNGITPLIPKRGTISASGDLMPLSYIAGTITGSPGIFCRLDPADSAYSPTLSAADVLKKCHLRPVELQKKEALSLINGTAPSAAAAALVIYQANNLAVIAEILTAFTSECLAGNVEWSHAFIHQVRPHLGQRECASNIRAFLKNSKLVVGHDEGKMHKHASGLCQDRYATRTAPQWIGPYLEDLVCASRQISTELNATSDNPIIDPSTQSIYSGGNFQATSTTSAMDKTRQAIMMIGRMIYSQCSELINPHLNNGLPTNLSVNPSLSYTMKGVDVNVAAYMSELASLSNPISAHIFPAEMYNQGINSMALASARRTADAIELANLMIASHLYVLCQAADLRVLKYLVEERIASIPITKITKGLGIQENQAQKLRDALTATVKETADSSNTLDIHDRYQKLAELISACVVRFLAAEGLQNDVSLSKIYVFATAYARITYSADTKSLQAWCRLEDEAGRTPTPYFLGTGTKRIYRFIREGLEVPMNRGLEDDPLVQRLENRELPRPCKTIGGWISVIYDALNDGRLVDEMMSSVISPLMVAKTPASSIDKAESDDREKDAKILDRFHQLYKDMCAEGPGAVIKCRI